MNKTLLFAAPLMALAFAGTAKALEVTYENDLRMPRVPISEEQRQADLALGNCLYRNGGRMERCGAQQARSERISQIERESAARTAASTSTVVPASNVLPPADVPTVVVVEPGPVVTEGPVSSMPPPENK